MLLLKLLDDDYCFKKINANFTKVFLFFHENVPQKIKAGSIPSVLIFDIFLTYNKIKCQIIPSAKLTENCAYFLIFSQISYFCKNYRSRKNVQDLLYFIIITEVVDIMRWNCKQHFFILLDKRVCQWLQKWKAAL